MKTFIASEPWSPSAPPTAPATPSPARPCPPIFDDHLGLAATDLRGVRLVVFIGVSGAGKSTAIEYLCREHRDFRERRPIVVAPERYDSRTFDVPKDSLAIVEELRSPRDLRCPWSLLRRGATVLAASHVGAWWTAPWALAWKRRVFRVDRDWRKIARQLERQGIEYSDAAVQAYCRRYGANYTDVDVILERSPDTSFDEALARFERWHRLDRR